AARGSDGRPYPWGPAPDSRLANLKDNPDDSWHHLVSGGSFRGGASPYRILNLVGNAAEWTATSSTPSLRAVRSFADQLKPSATPEESWHTIKGGSYKHTLAESAPSGRDVAPDRYSADDLGFRCAK